MSFPTTSAAPWSVRESQDFDSYLQRGLGLPAALLMEDAGGALAREALRRAREGGLDRILVLVGPGNNGGDGWVAARHLLGQYPVQVFQPLGAPRRSPGREAFAAGRAAGVPFGKDSLDTFAPSSTTLIVDALFGIGLSRPIEGSLAELLKRIQGIGCPVLAADLPSGLDGDEGQCLGRALPARWTLSFVAPKQGFTRGEGPRLVGEVGIATIGVSREFAEAWRRKRRDSGPPSA